MRLKDRDFAKPGAGEITVRHSAIGINFIDIYFRTGVYPAPHIPFTPGMEGAGEVVALGDGVSELQVGDRISYASAPIGADLCTCRCSRCP